MSPVTGRVVHRHEEHAAHWPGGVRGCDLAVAEADGWCGGDESLLVALAARLCHFRFNLSGSE
jgi:hypothetical protein